MQTAQSTTVTLAALTERCLQLAIEASTITEQCYQNSAIKQYDKGGDDPVTEADYKIQTMIVRGLARSWPGLRVVGEENKEYSGSIEVDYEHLPKVDLPSGADFDREYELGRLCVWIDPIDNTRGFIKGEAQAVTNLIGISYDQKAELGIIGVPFTKTSDNDEAVFQPSVFIGCASKQLCFQYSVKEETWRKLVSHKDSQKHIPKVTMSPTRKNLIERLITEKIAGEILLAGGAGYKILLVASGRADLMAYCESFTSKWDSCAGHAIVVALGGFFSDQRGHEILYDHEQESYLNREGLICGFSQRYYDVAVETYVSETAKAKAE